MDDVVSSFYFENEWLEKYQRLLSSINMPTTEKLMQIQNNLSDTLLQYNRIAEQELMATQAYTPSIIKALESIKIAIQRVTPSYEELIRQQELLASRISGFDNITNKCFESLNCAAKSFERVEISELIRMANTVEPPDKKYIDEVDNVSAEDQAIFVSEFTSALSDKNNWQQRIMSLFQRFQHTNPALAWLANTLFILILSILASLIANSIGQAKANAKIRQAPQSTAPVIVQIVESQEVAIVGDCPYYFEIEFENAESGEVVRGYISKRSFLPVESKEDKPDADA